MSEKLQIFNEPNFNEDIIREETHTYYPHTTSFGNSDEIEILINQQDVLVDLASSALFIEAEFQPEASGDGECKLTNNFGAFLFEYISYELNGKEIDKVRDPGIVSTIRAYLTYAKHESIPLAISGWSFKDVLSSVYNNKINLWIPLNFLLGLFIDYNKVLSGKHKLRLIRSRTDNDCYTNSTGTKTAKINVKTIALKVRHVFPSDQVKFQMLGNLSAEKPILIPFRSWDLHENPLMKESTRDIWAVKTSMNLERPRYVILAFQTDRKNNPVKHSAYFDNINLLNVKLYLNSECYPYEAMKLNFTDQQYVEAYQMYYDFQKSFSNKIISEPMLDYIAFKNRAIFVIDCSKQNDAIKSSTVDVKLEMESFLNFPKNTRAYCIIINDRIMEYSPITGSVRSLV